MKRGSFIVDELTELVEEAVLKEFESISERGGMLGAMSSATNAAKSRKSHRTTNSQRRLQDFQNCNAKHTPAMLQRLQCAVIVERIASSPLDIYAAVGNLRVRSPVPASSPATEISSSISSQ
jgi:hypothetical protein